MKKILAISGGVDSMVMLDMFRNDPDAVVAHFDHGTRPSSFTDAEFVWQAAARYGLPFFSKRVELGSNASEEIARISRYEYFEQLAGELGGEIYTAHHVNDLIESMAINLLRGTGWRGLAPFGNVVIRRPFLENTPVIGKREVYKYAASHKVVFRQDPTNTDDRYLRNRLRLRVSELDSGTIFELLKIYHEMNNLKTSVDAILAEILPEDGVFERKWFDDLDDAVALEILRAGLLRAGISATRPQILDFLRAIREYQPGKYFNLPGDRLVKFSKTSFALK